jgi:hypothetical protein
VIIPYDSTWPLWGRIAVTVVAVGIFAAMAWQYYKHFLRR